MVQMWSLLYPWRSRRHWMHSVSVLVLDLSRIVCLSVILVDCCMWNEPTSTYSLHSSVKWLWGSICSLWASSHLHVAVLSISAHNESLSSFSPYMLMLLTTHTAKCLWCDGWQWINVLNTPKPELYHAYKWPLMKHCRSVDRGEDALRSVCSGIF